MNIKIRRLIYLFFILVFLIIAPILVMYTSGYRYNLQKGKIEQVGVLSINILPKDAQIFLNDDLMGKERPLRLPSLRPNYYQIKVTKDNYYPWQKTLEVKSQASTLAFDIVLFKNSAPVILADTNIKTFTLSPKADAVAIANNEGVLIKNLNNETKKLIWATNGNGIEKITWSKDAKNLLIKKDSQFFVLNTNGASSAISLNNLVSNLQKAEWGNNTTIYGLADSNLMEITFDNKQTKKITSATEDFSFLDGNLYFTKKQDNKILTYKYNSLNIFNKLTAIAELPLATYQIEEMKNEWLSLSDGQKIYLIDLSGVKQPILTLNGVSAFWGAGTKNDYLYYFDKAELWIFDPAIKKSYMLSRYENDIQNILPLPNIPYYALQQGQNILLSEIDDRDQRQKYTVFQGRNVKDLQIDAEGKKLYFLDRLKNGYELFQLEIQ